MNTKQEILASIRLHTSQKFEMPDLNISGIKYPDTLQKFKEIAKIVGGNTYEISDNEDFNLAIKKLYPYAQNIASNLSDISIANINPDNLQSPHQLANIDLAIIQGDIGVAENACIWIPQLVKYKALYFIAEEIVIILDKKMIVDNMHQAYEKISFPEKGFGIFISGPSKTADIEQSLVVGAHGPKGLTVLLY